MFFSGLQDVVPMSVTEYIQKEKAIDVKYGIFIDRLINFTYKQLKILNCELAKINREEYNLTIRIKDSNVINAEICPFVFYINTSIFHACYNMNFNKYKEVFTNKNAKNFICQNPIDIPFQFIIHHELAHIYRDHANVKNINIDKQLFTRATEMDADALAISRVYRSLQSFLRKTSIVDELSIRGMVFLFVLEALYVMNKHSNGNVYLSEPGRLMDVMMKISMLNEVGGNPSDVNGTSKMTEKSILYIVELLKLCKKSFGEKDNISMFIDQFFEFVRSNKGEGAEVNKTWNQIKDNVAVTSNTNV